MSVEIDPIAEGYRDAQRGHTACPYGLPSWRADWATGYDKAIADGTAKYPRFGTIARKRNRR